MATPPLRKKTSYVELSEQIEVTNNKNSTEIQLIQLNPTIHNEYSQPEDIKCKVIVIGDAYSGKTTFLSNTDPQITHPSQNMNQYNYISTIGVDFQNVKYKNPETGELIHVHLWDTAGQERFKAILSSYYRDICAVIVFFDLTNYKSLRNVESYWLDEIKQHTNNPNPLIFLVGNKLDKLSNTINSTDISTTHVPNRIQVDAQNIAKKHNMVYLENQNTNILESKENMKTITRHILEKLHYNLLSVDNYIENNNKSQTNSETTSIGITYPNGKPKKIKLNGKYLFKSQHNIQSQAQAQYQSQTPTCMCNIM
jgi:small GTP-binding protein